MIVNRTTYIDQLVRSKGNGLIKIVTGIRRSGKSFLLKKLFRQHLLDDGVQDDHIIIIDMESRKNKAFKDPDYLLDYIDNVMKDDNTYYIIIDEVQEVNDFVEVLSTLSVTEGTDVYVTGSNSRFLSSDVVTEFRGRGDEIHVWPLSFKEYMSVYDGSVEKDGRNIECMEVYRNFYHKLVMTRKRISYFIFIAQFIYAIFMSATVLT